MQLLTIQEIRVALAAQFESMGPDFCELVLREGGDTLDTIAEAAKLLSVELPATFVSVANRLRLGGFVLGPTSFGNLSSYIAFVVSINSPSPAQWWGRGKRPGDSLCVAISDMFTVLLDCGTGRVDAMATPAEAAAQPRLRVASDFEMFFRGIGTTFLLRQADAIDDGLGVRVGGLAGASAEGMAYWVDLAK